jgi:hypothetical protein
VPLRNPRRQPSSLAGSRSVVVKRNGTFTVMQAERLR